MCFSIFACAETLNYLTFFYSDSPVNLALHSKVHYTISYTKPLQLPEFTLGESSLTKSGQKKVKIPHIHVPNMKP